jgi:glycosyltransferase involved in cell wall biosynthesis
MPVFNGERYLRKSIDSILNQTYQNFELIIADNASTDKTQLICQEYAKKDHRVRYYRNKKNIGGPRNYNKVFKLSSSEYFKWAAYDDVLAPEFLRKCIKVLDEDSTIVGCCSKTGRIDQNGIFINYYNKGLLTKISSPKTHERFRDLLGLYYTTTPFHGVYRSKLFAKSQLHGSYIGADRNLVAELSLMGRIFEITECLFFWRDHPASYTSIFYGKNREYSMDRVKQESAWWSKGSTSFFPHWRNCLEYFKSVNRVPLSYSERFLCYIQIFRWIMEEGRRFMTKDILFFILQRSSFISKLMKNIPSNLKRRFIHLVR